MGDINESSMRYRVLEDARSFKTSWINLGRALYTVWKDKLYKEWGYASFDTYASREIGIRKQTAIKLLKSYYFLEKEEPAYLETSGKNAASLPTYEAVDVLRLARNKRQLDKEDYDSIKKDVLEKGKNATDVKKGLAALVREREELEPEEARKRRRARLLKRFLGTLRSVRNEINASKMLPAEYVKEIDALIRKIENEIR